MIENLEGEPRIEYLARVLYSLMNETGAGEYISDYDGTTCDGLCLAQDFIDELGIDAD